MPTSELLGGGGNASSPPLPSVTPLLIGCMPSTNHLKTKIKGRVHCFSMQVVINKCFLLNPEKNLTQIRLVVIEKNAKNPHSIPKNDVSEPTARLL